MSSGNRRTRVLGGMLSLLAVATLSAAPTPLYHLELDGASAWSGRDAASAAPAVIHGAAKYVPGIAGQGLDIRRHAYDQVTALVCAKLPKFNTKRGTAAFWFKPHWNQLDPEHHAIFCGHGDQWKPIRFYLIKQKNGLVELTFAPSKQIQFLRSNVFKKDVWSHVAFTWDAAVGEVCLYLDGRLVERKVKSDAFDFPEEVWPLVFSCGNGTDRFKADVGDGVYDDIRFYDQSLSASEIFLLVAGGAVKMTPVALPPGGAFTFRFSQSELEAARPLMRLKGTGDASVTISALGVSRRLSVVVTCGGRTETLETADTLRLDHPYTFAFTNEGTNLVFSLDGARQGAFACGRPFGAFTSGEAVEGVTVTAPEPPAMCRAVREGEDPRETALWAWDDASVRTQGVRRAVSLNAYWRVWPVNDYLGAPPEGACGYMRVPGSFRSPLWRIHQLGDLAAAGTENDAKGSESWQGKPLTSYRAAWYGRTFETPVQTAAPGERTWLVFDNFNADAGRVYLNGRQIHAFRQDFKFFTKVPNRVRLDVTDLLAKTGRNDLLLYVDRHFVGLWRGVPAIGDHGEIALGDVWLERTPSQAFVQTAVALPSWRQKNVTLRVRVGNPSSVKGPAEVHVAFTRAGAPDKICTTNVVLSGACEQLVTWREAWGDPVTWTAETPRTYAMDVTLRQDGSVLDTFPTQRFGFREAWVEKGEIRLNGIPLRLRMWTSPGLDRLRYYYGDPAAIDQYVAGIRECNYDTVRCSPWGKTSCVGIFEYLDACDRQGLYNLHMMPAYEDEALGPYADAVVRFLEAYGNHPSILMWYTDFNTCSYAWNQDPAKLTATDYNPPSLRHPRARARQAERVMRAQDPSRELFQHAGGCSGRIFTSMNYQSYGTPLQEQEDWPAQWAKGHTQPLMVVESAFPYPGQFNHFERGAEGSLAAEQAARYFGAGVYADERYPMPHSSTWNNVVDGADGEDPNHARLCDLHYRRVVKAWRGYGMNALGDFPGGRDLTRAAETFNDHCVVYRTAGGNPKTPGLKPEATRGWSEVQRHILGDYSRPAYHHNVLRECFAPLLVFAAGDPDDFTNKDHAFWSGEAFRKSIVVVNDHLVPMKLAYTWRFRTGSREIAAGKGTCDVAAGGLVKVPLELRAPDVAERTAARLEVSVARDGAEIYQGTLELQIFPPAAKPKVSGRVSLYDPEGKTAELLRRAGVAFTSVARGADATGDLLIVGQRAGAHGPMDWTGFTGNVLVFEQVTNTVPGFIMAAPSCRDAFRRAQGHPVLEGLEDVDLANWRGASDAVPAFVVSEERTPHYPRSKWKCGNGGIVSGCTIRRPSRGNFRTLVDCGFNLEGAALLEEVGAVAGRRRSVVRCQLDVTCRYGRDPVATRLVNRLLEVYGGGGTRPAARSERVAYLGDDVDRTILAQLGADLPAWTGAGDAASVVLVLPGADRTKLPFAAPRTTSLQFRAAKPDDALFAEVSPADLYFRWANELPDPVFAVKREKGVAYVFLGARPDGTVKGAWNDEKLARVWSAVLTAAGVSLTPPTPYLEKLDLYDGDAFHNW